MLAALGALQVIGPDGPIDIASRHQRVLLLTLAVDRGEVVSIDQLADAIWGADLPVRPGPSLQSHVSRIRRVLPDSVAIETAPGGYRLVVADDDYDASRFEHAWDTATALPPDAALAVVEEALSLWRGEAFVEVDTDRARAESSRLSELHAAMEERHSELLLDLGRAADAVALLERQRATDPLREGTVALLMRALVATGRTPDALRVYQEHAAHLGEDLGLEPSPVLRDLEAAILTEEVVATPTPFGDGAVSLPASSFRGRAAELDELSALAGRQRMLTLVGPGGVGKTRLALHLAAERAPEHRDGIMVVELAAVRDPADVAEMVASRLGVPRRADVPVTERVVSSLAGRELLVVLDNCEHVIDAAAELAEALVRHTTAVEVLATSREPLNIDGEQCWPVRPLLGDDGLDAAIAIFVDRAQAAQPTFTLDEADRAQVERLCRQLDGLPLAIELVAARMATFSLAELVTGLEEPLALASRGRRTADARHRSLRALVDWSTAQLTEAQLDAFRALSTFAGSFTLDGAAALIAGSRAEASDLVADLVERSLLTASNTNADPTQYGYLETVRAVAREQLEATSQATTVGARHAQWVVERARDLAAELVTADEVTASAAIGRLRPELRTAHSFLLESEDAATAFALSIALHQWAWIRMQSEVLGWATATAARFADVDDPDLSLVLWSAATGASQGGDLVGAEELVARGEEAATGRPTAVRGALEVAGDLALYKGRLDEAVCCYEKALELASEERDVLCEMVNCGNLIIALGYAGRPDDAAAEVGRARELIAAHPSPTMQAWIDYAEGESLAERDTARALELLTRAVAGAETTGAKFVTGVAGLTLVTTRARAGDPSAAVPEIAVLVEHWWREGNWTQQWTTLRAAIELLARLGSADAAARLMGAMSSSPVTTEVFGPDAVRLGTIEAQLRDQLGDGYEAALATGSAMGDAAAAREAIAELRALPEDGGCSSQ